MAGTALAGRAVGAEADGDGGPRVAWNRTYGDEFWQRGRSVVQTPDGGLLVAGETATGGGYGALLVRTDADGDAEWTRTYDDRPQGAIDVLAAPDGGYVLVLDARTPDDGNRVAAMGVTEDGTVRWRREYDFADASVSDAVRRSDGGYAVVGTTSAVDAPAGAFLLTLDAEGEREGVETYSGDDGGSLFGRAVVEADGGFALLAIEVVGNDFSPLLVRTDASGVERWRRQYDVRGVDRGEDLVRAADGGFVVAGSARGVVCDESVPGQPEEITTGPDAFLLKVNADGARQWAETFSAPGSEYASADAATVVWSPDGGYAFAGTRDDPDGGDTPFWVVGTDADGERLWERTAGGRQYDSPFSMITTADGGYAVVGLTDAGYPAEPDVRLVGLTDDA